MRSAGSICVTCSPPTRAGASGVALQMADCYVEYSRNLVTDTTLELLTALAQRVGLTDRIAAMFSGAHLNATEHWAVLHTALRLPRTAALTAVRLRCCTSAAASAATCAPSWRRCSPGGPRCRLRTWTT